MEVAEAFELISHAIDTGRVAHGYLIVGELNGNCRELTMLILHKLFPDDADQVDALTHPDIAVLQTEGAKGIIKVDSMRDIIVTPMALKSYSGGWKVGVIFGADRMEAASANAFLKSLEEPPANTLYLLLTDKPDAILPTIISRSQRVDLKHGAPLVDAETAQQIIELFKARKVSVLAQMLKDAKDDMESPDYQQFRQGFYQTLIEFARSLMITEAVPRYQAFRNIEAVEETFRMSCASMNEESILSFLISRMVLPQ